MNATYEATKAELKKDLPALMAELEAAGVQRWKGRACACPFCDDTNPSAGTYTKDGTEHYNCFSCGFNGDIFDVRAKRTGQPAADILRDLARETVAPKALPPTPPPAQPTKPPPPLPPALTIEALSAALGVSVDALEAQGTHRGEGCWRTPERDAQGNVIGHALRLDAPTFLSGKWTSKISEKGGHRGLTMQWPLSEFAGASIDDPIIGIEGATDQAAAHDLGMVGIGRPSATGGGDLLRIVCKDRHVCIVGENDKKDGGEWPGRDGAEKIADALRPVAASVKVIYPPVEVKDLRAWKAAGLTGDQLRNTIEAAPLWTPSKQSQSQQFTPPKRKFIMKRGNEIESTGIDYLWDRRIPMASITVIFSRPGRGKSTIAASITGHVTKGEDWPDGSPCPRGDVLYIKGEGSDAAMKERMEGHGADPARYGMISRTDDDDAAMIDLALDGKLFDEVLTPATKCIVIDTLDSLFPSMRMIDNANIRKCLWPLQQIAEQRGVAIIVLAHTNKGGYADPLDRLSGGRAIGAAARAIWYLGKVDPKADDCFMSSVKCNDFLPADTIGYRIAGIGPDSPGYIAWGTTCDLSAWDLDGPPKSEDQIDKAELCTSWLADLLADGPRPVAEVQRLADALAYGRKVMTKAKVALDTRATAQKGTRPPVYWLCLLGQCPPPLSMTPEGVTSDFSEITDVTPLQPKARGAGIGVQA